MSIHCLLLFQSVLAQYIRGPIRGPYGLPYGYNSLPVNVPVMSQPAVPNVIANLPLNTNLPIQYSQLANTAVPVNYGYSQNLQYNTLPLNFINQPITTNSPKIALVKLNIPIVNNEQTQNLSPYNRIQYSLGNNIKIANLPLNSQIINNVPIQQRYAYVQPNFQLPALGNNVKITNLPLNNQIINSLPINNGPTQQRYIYVQPNLQMPALGNSIRITNSPLNNQIINGLPINNGPIQQKYIYVQPNFQLPALGNNIRITNLPLNNQIVNNLPIQQGYSYVQPNSQFQLNNRVVTNMPVVPLNTLATLPTFNGMPVIKVKKTVYKVL